MQINIAMFEGCQFDSPSLFGTVTHEGDALCLDGVPIATNEKILNKLYSEYNSQQISGFSEIYADYFYEL